jgi:hypothetical protein
MIGTSKPKSFPDRKRILRKWLGAGHRVGQGLCSWILPISADQCRAVQITRTTIKLLTEDKLRDPAIIEKLRVFDAAIKLKLDGTDDVTGETVRFGRG